MSGSRTYGGWSKDRSGWFFGFSGAQMVICVAAAMPIWLAMAGQRWLLALLMVPVWALVAGGVLAPVRGRPAVVWLKDVLLVSGGSLLGWTAFSSRAETGHVSGPVGPYQLFARPGQGDVAGSDAGGAR